MRSMKTPIIRQGLQLTQYSKLKDYTRRVFSEHAQPKHTPTNATSTDNSGAKHTHFDALLTRKKPGFDKDDHSNFAFIPFFGMPQLQTRTIDHLPQLTEATIDYLERATRITIMIYLIPRLEETIIKEIAIPLLTDLLLPLSNIRRSVSKNLQQITLSSNQTTTLAKRKRTRSIPDIHFHEHPNASDLVQRLFDTLTQYSPLEVFPFFNSAIQEFVLFNLEYRANGTWFNQDISTKDVQHYLHNQLFNTSLPSRITQLIPTHDNRREFYYRAALKRHPEQSQNKLLEWWLNRRFINQSPQDIINVLTKNKISNSPITLDSTEIGTLLVETSIRSGTITQELKLNIDTLREPILIDEKEIKHLTFILDIGASLGHTRPHLSGAATPTAWQCALDLLIHAINTLKAQHDTHTIVTLIVFRDQAATLLKETPINHIPVNLIQQINQQRQSLGHLTNYQSFLPHITNNTKAILITDGNAHDEKKILKRQLAKLTCQWLVCHLNHQDASSELLPLFTSSKPNRLFSLEPKNRFSIPPSFLNHADTIFDQIKLRIQLHADQGNTVADEEHCVNLTGKVHHINQTIKGTLTRFRLWVDGDEADCENHYLCSRSSKSKTSISRQSKSYPSWLHA